MRWGRFFMLRKILMLGNRLTRRNAVPTHYLEGKIGTTLGNEMQSQHGHVSLSPPSERFQLSITTRHSSALTWFAGQSHVC